MKHSQLLLLVMIFFGIFTLNTNAQDAFSSKSAVNVSLDYDVVIYPNPVTNDFFSVKSDQTIKTVEVLNVIGQCVKRVDNETGVSYNIFVKIPDCEKGMYMVKITFEDNNTIIRKIFVKK